MKQVVGDADRGDDCAGKARALPEGVAEHGPEGAESLTEKES